MPMKQNFLLFCSKIYKGLFIQKTYFKSKDQSLDDFGKKAIRNNENER